MSVRKLASIGLLLTLLSVTGFLGLSAMVERFIYATASETNVDLLNHEATTAEHLHAQQQILSQSIADKEAEIKAKQDALAKLTTDLAVKQGDLDKATKSIAAQQQQLATDSADLKRLQSHPADRPPLFN